MDVAEIRAELDKCHQSFTVGSAEMLCKQIALLTEAVLLSAAVVEDGFDDVSNAIHRGSD